VRVEKEPVVKEEVSVGKRKVQDTDRHEAPRRAKAARRGGPRPPSGDQFGIDQGPVVLMIENYRTGLIWDLMRRCRRWSQGCGGPGSRAAGCSAAADGGGPGAGAVGPGRQTMRPRGGARPSVQSPEGSTVGDSWPPDR
jgi:hypothetical protein